MSSVSSSLVGATRSPRGLFKPVAWLIALVLAVGGVTFYQGTVATEAEAVTLSGGWDGTFRKDQLWLSRNDSSNNRYMGGWSNPGNQQLTSGTWTQWFDMRGTTNGSGVSSARATIAVGPLFMAEGDRSLAMAAFGYDNDVTVVSKAGSQVNAANWADLTGSDPAGHDCSWSGLSTGKWGGEINQKNGYLYVNSRYRYDWNGDATATATSGTRNYSVAIFNLRKSGTSTCLISSSGKSITSKSGRTVNQQWADQFNESISGDWGISSDMAIDADGNFYVWGRFEDASSSQGRHSRHVLLSIQPPTNANGTYNPNGTWYYEVARFFNGDMQTVEGSTNGDGARANGMAFLDGKLYFMFNSTNHMAELDTLSGVMTDKGAIYDSRDLASAQVAPVIRGKVYNDANGDGVISAAEQATGVGNVEVEIWQQTGSSAPVNKGTLMTDSTGAYHGLLPSASDNFYLRIKQPQIGGVNALQTYASGGTFFYDTDGMGDRDEEEINTVTPYCHNSGGDYAILPNGGDCRGARADRIDPSNVTNPLAASGGAYILTKVDMNSDLVVVEADFGISVAGGSFGDAKANVNSTIAANGPRFVNTTYQRVWLGSQAASGQSNGVNDANSNAHSSDDGVVLVTDSGQELPLQNQVLAAGVGYKLRASAASDPALGAGKAGVHVAGWSTEKASPAAFGATSPMVIYGSTDDQGKVESDGYVVDPTISSTTQGVMRFIASQNDTIVTPDNSSSMRQYAPPRGNGTANSQPWAS
ncbi:MAG: hypothetical protein LBL55_09520, partial [Propionibacteriaceae bacterium]|nr:hypothetical protein [Propionibacteriaceae bacterium]